MAPSVEKKIAELEMGLLHLQQNIDIPEISLTIHPTVVTVVKQKETQGLRARVQDFGDKVEDSTYLNALQHGVNRWIREIQKVSDGWNLFFVSALLAFHISRHVETAVCKSAVCREIHFY